MSGAATKVWRLDGKRRSISFTICLILAISIILNGLYNDYSDASVHTAGGIAVVLFGLFLPRLGASLGMVWVLAVVLAQTFRPDAAFFGATLRPGMSRSEIIERLGDPERVINSSREMTELSVGYGKPSPWRFPQAGPVELYVRGEWVLWVFYDSAGRMTYYFVGGT